MSDSTSMHPSMQFLPSGEIDNRITKSADTVRGEFREDMKNVLSKVDTITNQLTLIVGTAETPGVLTRIEDRLDEVVTNQNAMRDLHEGRVVEDDRFRMSALAEIAAARMETSEVRKEVEILKKELNFFRTVITIGQAFLRITSRIGDSSWVMKMILAFVSFLLGINLVHVVWPMIRESIRHHHFMF